jgi:hypothetical protein
MTSQVPETSDCLSCRPATSVRSHSSPRACLTGLFVVPEVSTVGRFGPAGLEGSGNARSVRSGVVGPCLTTLLTRGLVRVPVLAIALGRPMLSICLHGTQSSQSVPEKHEFPVSFVSCFSGASVRGFRRHVEQGLGSTIQFGEVAFALLRVGGAPVLLAV